MSESMKDKATQLFRQLDASPAPAAPAPAATAPVAKLTEEQADSPLRQAVAAALRQVYDPEIPVNIYDLGLIYTLNVDPEAGTAYIEMTLTAPGCPVAGTFPQMVATAVRAVPGINDVQVELVWDPPWTQDRMTDAVRLQLGLL